MLHAVEYSKSLVESSMIKLSFKADFRTCIMIILSILDRKRKLKTEMPIIDLDSMVDKVIAYIEQKKQERDTGGTRYGSDRWV